ncbi:MAG: DHH family phosphoesterase, partial [Nanoarchaeota archaeon]
MDFETVVAEAAHFFAAQPATQPVRIISNKDTDGITAAAILVVALRSSNQPSVTTFIKQLTPDFLTTLERESYTVYFFLDMGASSLSLLAQHLAGKTLFVLDHHYPSSAVLPAQIIHLNPHLLQIDGTKSISAAGIAYLFAKALHPSHISLAYLAVIGALGDMQEHFGFRGLNETILKDALLSRRLSLHYGLRLFGIHTKPLHKFLTYTTSPYIPSVSGSEKGALQFLKTIGIQPREGERYKWLSDLAEQDIEKLSSALLVYQSPSLSLSTLFGPLYLLPREPRDSPTYDAIEFSTLLNACGKMGHPSLGLGVCLGDKKCLEKATLLLHHYHHEIMECLIWFYKFRGTPAVQETESYVFIQAENAIRDGLIGTLVSLLSKSHLYVEGTVLIGSATMLSDEIKVSSRICGFKESPLDLRKIILQALEKTGGQGGGHRLAAGAILPSGKGSLFLQACASLLQQE